MLVLTEPPFAKYALPRVGGRDPVVHGARNNPDRMRRFRLLPNRDQELGAVSLLGVGECLDLIERCIVQMNVLAKRSQITGLFANDLRGRVLYDPGAVFIGTVGGPYEIFRRLADAPNACIAFARSAKQLHYDCGENRRLKQRPAFIEQDNAWLSIHP